MADEQKEARPYFRKLAAMILIIGAVQVPFVIWIAAGTSDWWSFLTWVAGIAPGIIIFYSIATKGRLTGRTDSKDN